MTRPVTRAGRANIVWAGRMPLEQAGRRGVPAAGVYVLERGGTPLYVGKATRFRTRLPAHVRRFGRDGVTVRFGRIAAASDTLIRTAEHTVIRSLMRAGYHLRNRSSVRPFRVEAGRPVVVRSHGERPAYIPGRVVVAGAGARYES